MEALLKHLVDITCQRDHTLLDSSIVSALHELVGASRVFVHELFRFRDELYIRPRVGINNGKIVSMEEAPDNHGEPITRYPALVESIKQRKTCMEDVNAAGDRTLWLPVWLNDKVSTCLEVTNPTPYSSHTLHMMEGILSVYRNYQNILDYSERDSLTGLLNRKTFDEKFSRLLTSSSPESGLQERDERRHQPAPGIGQWLAVVDIDHFKRVNDQFGHLYGDEVLILVANLLRQSFRSQDRVFRFGGEEFVVLLRSTTLEDARKIFERFRTNVEQHEFPQVGKVTVSLGFASISNESPVVILGHADQALYYAKANGRNRVCYYDELVKSGELHSEVSNDTVEFF
ncbi:GGDEF domain-containing protein [Noviherbaspirillum sp. Root189]|uniref:GGDEF domain-containing protein n=1 Tax=Noviherbaspirillum sp. Root189 TaxID=1736487 RepID=UPI00070A7681|nr:GGDEF domain-containing protein [Noviherbaspirillum sp. Root189]KRB94001.1 diguanylate cyclase [Noviherbaspirillum sp. Root189]